MEISEMLKLVATPFGIGLVGLFLSEWLIDRLYISKKVLTSWIVGIILSAIMLALGKFAAFGAYAVFDFNSWQDWVTFALVALSPGPISNGLFSSKLLETILNMIRK